MFFSHIFNLILHRAIPATRREAGTQVSGFVLPARVRQGRLIRIVATVIMILSANCLPAGENISSGGSGLWTAPATWKGGRVPGNADQVTISSGDKVMSDADYSAPMCAGVRVEKDAILDVRQTFIPAGSVSVTGALNLLPGSSLKVACETNAQYGIEVGERGILTAENSVITSFTQDGAHNTFIVIGGKWDNARGEFTRCDISYLGRPRRHGEPPSFRDDGLLFYRNSGAKLVDCRIHHNQGVHFVIADHAEIRGNHIHTNVVGLQIFQFHDFTISENDIYDNQTGIGCHVDVMRYENLIENNRIHNNGTGIAFTSFGKSQLRRNLYWDNREAITFGAFPDDLSYYLEHERMYSNGRGIDIRSPSKSSRLYALQSCVFGEDGTGKACPNTEADIRLPDRKPGEAGIEVVMDSCKFTSATPIVNIQKGDRITSMNHNQAPGVEKEWVGGNKNQE